MSRRIASAAARAVTFRHPAKAGAVLAVFTLFASMVVLARDQASAAEGDFSAVFGTVVEVSLPDSLTLATDSGVVSLSVPSNDVFTGDITAIDEISEGDRVIASAIEQADGSLAAHRVLVKADLSQAVTKHILGVVMVALDGTLTLQDSTGNTITLDLPEGIEVPEPGTAVIVVAQLDRATGQLTLRAMELVEDSVQRLQEAADDLADGELKDELEARLERARNQHLSVLDSARSALEKARDAITDLSPERESAEQQLAEVQTQFDELRERYELAAQERNENSPELRIAGILHQGEPDAWQLPEGAFDISPSGDEADEDALRLFAWNESTLAVIPLEVSTVEGDPDLPIITGRELINSVPVPLNDVKDFIDDGARVIVQYGTDGEPPLATLITVLPPELDQELQDALYRERLRNFQGVITLVEQTPSLDSALGVVVVANRSIDAKIVAKVTSSTEIEVDGQPAAIGNLAAGMAAEIEFDVASLPDDADATLLVDGRLDAKSIRARTIVDDDEAHVAGVIAWHNIDTGFVGIRAGDGNVVRAQVIDDSVIVKDGAPARFSQLAVGDLVLDATRFNRETLILGRLVVQSPRTITFSGAITGLNRNPDRMTVATADGRVLTAFVTSTTVIVSEELGEISFLDLSVGDNVLKGTVKPVTRDDRTVFAAVALSIGQPRVSTARGVVASVDDATGELVVATGNSTPAPATDDGGVAGDAPESATDVTAPEEGSEVAAPGEPELLQLFVVPGARAALMKNGVLIEGLEPIEPGDIVESVSYLTSVNRILKLSVVTPNLQRVRGQVAAIDEDRLGLAIATTSGRLVRVEITDQTVIKLNGRTVPSLLGVEVRDIVSEAVFVANDDTAVAGIALSLNIFSRNTIEPDSGLIAGLPNGTAPALPSTAPVVETVVSGVIENIDGNVWTLANRRFLVTDSTQFFGEAPRVGLVAKAVLRARLDGVFVATAISVAGSPDTNPTTRPFAVEPVRPADGSGGTSADTSLVRVSGRVVSVEGQRDGTFIILIDGVKIVLNTSTEIKGEPLAGAFATALVRRTLSGAVVAVSVAFMEVAEEAPETTDDSDAASEDSAFSNTGSSITASLQITIVVQEKSGRLVLGDGKLVLLARDPADAVEIGDTLAVTVKRVERGSVLSVLPVLDVVAVVNNPLYLANSASADNALYVAI